MTYLVIDNDGALHQREQHPTSAILDQEVGVGGWARVRLGAPGHAATAAGWVNDSGFLLKLPRNTVGSCLLWSLGAGQQPYAGAVVLTGWHEYDEIVPLTGEQVAAMRCMHRDIRIILGLDSGELSNLAAPRWQRAMVKAAELVHDEPTPTITVIGPDHPRWPFGGAQ